MIYKTIGGIPIHCDSWPADVFYLTSAMEIDADGSPRAYAPYGKGFSPLDILSDAGLPGRGYGVARKNGKLYVQGVSDPCPGFYVSTTSLVDPHKNEWDTARYANAEEVPYFVLPSSPSLPMHIGQLGMLFRPATGDSSAAIYGDVGPENQIGEGSIKLAKNLGATPNQSGAVHGGLDHIVTLLFCHSTHSWPRTNEDILKEANDLFIKWGGFKALKARLPAFDWSKF